LTPGAFMLILTRICYWAATRLSFPWHQSESYTRGMQKGASNTWKQSTNTCRIIVWNIGWDDLEIGEAVKRDISRAMEHGMNKIRKLYILPFSPQITQAMLQWR
jgi:hypothetical protein